MKSIFDLIRISLLLRNLKVYGLYYIFEVKQSNKSNKNTQLERSHTNDDNEVDVLYTSMDHEVLDLNMTNT